VFGNSLLPEHLKTSQITEDAEFEIVEPLKLDAPKTENNDKA